MDEIKGMSNIELVDFVGNTKGQFREYSSLQYYLDIPKEQRRHVFTSLLEGVDFKGKSVIDIGPGTGESLDIAMERGASFTSFIDRDEIIFLYCSNLGHHGIMMDYVPFIVNKVINTIPKHDILITKGSFDFDWINDEPRFDNQRLVNWLSEIADTIIFVPTWNARYKHTCTPDRFSFYLESPLHKCFIDNGYKQTFIEGCNDKERFPITYIKTPSL